MKREKLESIVKRIMRGTPGFGFEFSVSALFEVASFCHQFPDIYKRAIDNLVTYGVLSYSREGNYSMKARGFNFSNNLKMGGRELYFVCRAHCTEFAGKQEAVISSYTKTLEVVQEGEFQISDSPGIIEWNVIRLKYEKKERVIGKLVSENIITKNREGSFSVIFRPDSKKFKILNFIGYKGTEYFFVSQGIAETYARSFYDGNVRAVMN